MTRPPPPGPLSGTVVVGIDGTPASARALDWAAQQAALEHRGLTVAHCVHDPADHAGIWTGGIGTDRPDRPDRLDRPDSPRERALDAGREVLAAAAERVQRLHPAVTVHRVLSTADPRQQLLDLGDHASTVVVGSRGRGALASLLLGSVSVEVAEQARCPVVVVRHDQDAPKRAGVLVEDDGTAHSKAAVEFAWATAAMRALPLTAVHVLRDVAPGLDHHRVLLAESVAGMRARFPDVRDRTLVVRGERDGELIAASRDMDLVVVGTQHGGWLRSLPAFGLAAKVVEHAACDVAVVGSWASARP